jgi:DNA-binding response OmpR family regulator
MTGSSNHSWYVFDQQIRILMVDDDPILREFASVHLTSPMSEVLLAPDASTALDLLQQQQVDIAMLDVDMPGMNGFELIERIRSQDKYRNLPVVMVTGREDIMSIDRAYAIGATSFVTKPVNWRQISHHLRYVIRASKQQSDAPAPQKIYSSGNGSVAWISASQRREFATALGAIINAAKRIANGKALNGEAAQEIIAAAEALLLKSGVNQGHAEGLPLTIPRPTQQSLPRAS